MEIIRLPFKERACVFVTKDGSKIIVYPGNRVYDCTPADLPISAVVTSYGMDSADGELAIYPAGKWDNVAFIGRGVISGGDHCSYVHRPDLGCPRMYIKKATPDSIITNEQYEECAIDAINENLLNGIAHYHRSSRKVSAYRVKIDNPDSAVTVTTSLRGKNAWMRFSYLKLDSGLTNMYVSIINNKVVYSGDEEHMYLRWLAESGKGEITTSVTTHDANSCINSYIITVSGHDGGAVWLSRKLIEKNIVSILDDRVSIGEEIKIEERFMKFLGVLADIVQKSSKSTPMQGMAEIAYENVYINTYPELDSFKFND